VTSPFLFLYLDVSTPAAAAAAAESLFILSGLSNKSRKLRFYLSNSNSMTKINTLPK